MVQHLITESLFPPEFDRWIARFRRHLSAEGKAPKTLKIYGDAVAHLGRWSAQAFDLESGEPLSTDPLQVTRRQLEQFFIECHKGLAANTVNQRFRSLQQFYRWLEDEEEISVSPLSRIKVPPAVLPPVPIIQPGDLAALLALKKGKGFEDRRDTAIISMFIDTGVRCGEMAGMEVTSLDLDQRCIEVLGKGGKRRIVVFGRSTVRALDRYLRMRDEHSHVESSRLWLSRKGRFTDWGMRQMIERACLDANIPHVFPHQFRHTFSHQWLKDGGEGEDLMRLNGWSSRAMLIRYGASAADERAQEAYRKKESPSDRL